MLCFCLKGCCGCGGCSAVRWGVCVFGVGLDFVDLVVVVGVWSF